MTSASKAVVDAIGTNWNVGTGGTKPAIYNSEAVSMFPTDDDWIMDLNWLYGKKRKRRNESYVGEKDYVGLRVHSRNDANKEARLDEIVNEIYRVVTPANVSGYNVVDIIDQHRRESDKRTNTYIADLLVELVILSTASASTPGSTTTSEIEVDELTVNTSIAGNPTAAIRTLDMNPTATGTQDIIDITPTASLVAGSIWIGLDQNLDNLDPATGAACSVIGFRYTTSGMVSVDHDATVYGFVASGAPDNHYGVYVAESGGGGQAGVLHVSFYSVNSEALTTTHTVRGLHIDWDGASRSSNAPVLEGVKVELPADYSNFGANKAGYFSGDGRTVTLCDTNYAADISGDYRLDGMTNAQLEDLLMFGSANAAWVPMIWEGVENAILTKYIDGRHINVDGTNHHISFILPIPTNRGSLKLYLKSLKFALQDADAEAYVDDVRISGINSNTRTDIDNDPTDYNSAGDKTFSGTTFPAAVIDASTYQTIIVRIEVVVDAANELDLHNIRMECYYAA